MVLGNPCERTVWPPHKLRITVLKVKWNPISPRVNPKILTISHVFVLGEEGGNDKGPYRLVALNNGMYWPTISEFKLHDEGIYRFSSVCDGKCVPWLPAVICGLQITIGIHGLIEAPPKQLVTLSPYSSLPGYVCIYLNSPSHFSLWAQHEFILSLFSDYIFKFVRNWTHEFGGTTAQCTLIYLQEVNSCPLILQIHFCFHPGPAQSFCIEIFELSVPWPWRLSPSVSSTFSCLCSEFHLFSMAPVC